MQSLRMLATRALAESTTMAPADGGVEKLWTLATRALVEGKHVEEKRKHPGRSSTLRVFLLMILVTLGIDSWITTLTITGLVLKLYYDVTYWATLKASAALKKQLHKLTDRKKHPKFFIRLNRNAVSYFHTNPTTESVNWFNFVANRLWKDGLRDILNDVSQKQINQYFRSRAQMTNSTVLRHLLEEIRVDHIDWGSKMPNIIGVTCFKVSLLQDEQWKDVAPFGDSLTLDFGLLLDLQTDIGVSLPYGYEFTIKRIKICGVIAFRFDMLRDVKGPANLKICFVKRPVIDYEFGGCLSWLNRPNDAKYCLISVITWLIDKFLVLPSHIKIPFVDLQAIKAQQTRLSRPQGLLRLEIDRGRKLQGLSHTEQWGSQMIYGFWGYIHPYTVCNVDSDYGDKTNVVKKSCDPSWNAKMHIPITEEQYKTGELRFHVMDYTVAKPCLHDENIGNSTVGIGKVVDLCLKQEKIDEWVSVAKETGEIRIKITYAPVVVDRPLTTNSNRAIFNLMIHEVQMWAVVENPILVVEMSGRTARVTSGEGHAGRIFSVGQDFTFYVSNVKTDKLTISLVSSRESRFSVMKLASYAKKGITVLLSEGRVPTKGAGQERYSRNKKVLLAQASHEVSFFTGKKQTVALYPLADGHSFDVTLISGIAYMEDYEKDDFSDSEDELE